jgi:hypothetical protein
MNSFLRSCLWCWVLLFTVQATGQQDSLPRKQPATVRSTTLKKDSTAVPVPMVSDSVAIKDSLYLDSVKVAKADSLAAIIAALPKIDTSTYQRIAWHPYLPLKAKPLYMLIDMRKHEDRDIIFYLLMGVLLILGFVRTVFPRYFNNLFVLFLQTSLRQKQTKDQLLQDNLGSLFVNLLFLITTSIYAALVAQEKEWLTDPFWHIAFFSAGVLLAVYLGKFLFLRFAGWVFNAREASGQYTFTVFLVNKVLGVILIPFLFLMAFSSPSIQTVAFTVSLGLIAILLLYRYLVSFTMLRNSLKVNALHFLLYLCAVEILPLLLLYKLMTDYISGRF